MQSDALLRHLEEIWIAFEADEVAIGVDAGDGGCAGAHEGIEHEVAGIGVGPNKIFKQRDGLLCRMDSLTFRWHAQDSTGIAVAGILRDGAADVSTQVRNESAAASGAVRLAGG